MKLFNKTLVKGENHKLSTKLSIVSSATRQQYDDHDQQQKTHSHAHACRGGEPNRINKFKNCLLTCFGFCIQSAMALESGLNSSFEI